MGTIDEGAKNAVLTCMGLKSGEHVLIISDYAQKEVGESLRKASEEQSPGNVKLTVIEQIATRPISTIPRKILEELTDSDVTFWRATSKPGELPVREHFIKLAKKVARHAHMPNVTPALMQQGMCADYEEVFERTQYMKK